MLDSPPSSTIMAPHPSLLALSRSIERPGQRLSRIFYFDSAPEERRKKVIVLVHGLGDEADTWRHVYSLLGDEYRLLALDLPGFGRSLVGGPTSMALAVEALGILIGQSGVEDFNLVGSSLGATICQLAAPRHYSRVASLCLVDGGLPSSAKPDSNLLAMALPLVGRRAYTALRANHAAAIISLDRYYADFKGLPAAERAFLETRVIERVESYEQRRAYLSLLRSAIFTSLRASGSLGAALAAWDRPLAVIWGEKDRIMPVGVGEGLARLAPSSTFRLLAGAGHLPQQDAPDALAKAIAETVG